MALSRRGLRSAALLLLLPALAALPALAPVGSAAADPVPPDGLSWPACGTAPDDDGRYCVLSVTRNGVPVPPVDYGTDGVYLDPYIDLIGAGDIRFGVQRLTVAGGGAVLADGDVSPADTYRWVVNTGAIQPRELYGHVRDASFAGSGGPTTGWVLTLELKPTPIAWTWPPDADGDGWADCSYDGGCGDDTTVAGLVYDGFVTGYVTDLEGEGLSPAEIADRTGLVRAYNAEDAYVLQPAPPGTRRAGDRLLRDVPADRLPGQPARCGRAALAHRRLVHGAPRRGRDAGPVHAHPRAGRCAPGDRGHLLLHARLPDPAAADASGAPADHVADPGRGQRGVAAAAGARGRRRRTDHRVRRPLPRTPRRLGARSGDLPGPRHQPGRRRAVEPQPRRVRPGPPHGRRPGAPATRDQPRVRSGH